VHRKRKTTRYLVPTYHTQKRIKTNKVGLGFRVNLLLHKGPLYVEELFLKKKKFELKWNFKPNIFKIKNKK
jgi:hypothetical protein